MAWPARRILWARGALVIVVVLIVCAAVDAALAQPFGMSRSPAPAEVGGFTGWILAKQAEFYRQFSGLIRAAKTDGSAAYTLMGVSFLYGIFHAAGPGHGKAVLASYMIANETALRRGLLLAGLAALLQGAVAIAIVGIAAIVFNATAEHMSDAASLVETLSYGAIAALGARLVWTKGGALLQELRRKPTPRERGGIRCEAADDPLHVHCPDCGHVHAPDPATLSVGFSWPQALATVVAAGARPCSGAILVLVFSLSQGLFMAGALSTLLMATGTAITTGALASLAVFGKNAAVRLAEPSSRRGVLMARGAEFLAAVLVLGLGLAMLAGASPALAGA